MDKKTLKEMSSEEIKEARRSELLSTQQQISLERNQAQVGRILPILVEGFGDGISIGRSYRDAPEIDGLVIVPGELPVGEIVPVRIDGAMVYDLTASIEIQPAQTIMPIILASEEGDAGHNGAG